MSGTTYLGTSYKIWYWSLHVTLRGGIYLHLVSICALVYIYSYKLTVSNGGGGHLALVSIWSLYILISWLFWMGEGVIWLWYLYVHWSLYILISWPFQMGLHLWHRSAKSSLLSLGVSNWGEGGSSAFGIYMCSVIHIYIDLPLHEIYQ